MILSELIPFLKEHEARPKKSLSQNFLVDPNILKKIVETAAIQPGDAVLEIGPGPGALTTALLNAGARVYAVEMDTLFANELSRLQTPDERLQVFEADFLKFDLRRLPPSLKVAANLPYHITAPILEKICAHSSQFTSLTLMVQKEVADRMAASSGSKQFGSLTVFLQFHAAIGRPFIVPPGCFYPRPKVDSAVIRLDFRKKPDVEPSSFFSLVRQAFQQRRKMVTTSIQKLYPIEKIRAALCSFGANPLARPEDLSLEEWVSLHQYLTNGISR